MSEIVALVLAIVLAMSAIGKALGPSRFRNTLIDTYTIPPSLATAMAPVVIAAEGTVALLLVIPATADVGLAAASALLLAVSGPALGAWLNGKEGDCGCFGVLISTKLSGWTIVRLQLAGLAAFIALLSRHVVVSAPERLPGGDLHILLAAAGTLAAGGLVYAAIHVFGRAERME